MKFLIKILYFLLIIFVLNIIFYYISDDYKVFLKKIKYDDTTNDIQTNINNFDTTIDNNLNNDLNNIEIDDSFQKDVHIDTNNEILSINIDNDIIVQETILWKNYKEILNKFEKNYDFDKIEVNTNLFEITDEYPDSYYEYYSSDLTLYFFTTKEYFEIYDIFDYLQNDSPFLVNEVNNFWEKSFYINLNEEVDDKYIRVVITNNGITYWLKIKNNQYEIVKNILNK